MSADLERKCRKCGCTEKTACVTNGVACSWIEADLCSACAAPPLCLEPSDLAALSLAPPMAIELDATQALILLATMQVAMRHPDFEKQFTAHNFVFDLAKALAEAVGVTPNLKSLCAAGWRANEEPPSHSRLILPLTIKKPRLFTAA